MKIKETKKDLLQLLFVWRRNCWKNCIIQKFVGIGWKWLENVCYILYRMS
jgi:hypothetical protein